MHLCHIVICGLSSFPMFPHYLINGAIFEEVIGNKMCFISTTFSKTFLILSRTEGDVIKYVHRSSCKVTVMVFGFTRNLYFLDRFSKNTHIKFNANPSSGSRVVLCVRTDRQIWQG
jgi:hypothetical protein